MADMRDRLIELLGNVFLPINERNAFGSYDTVGETTLGYNDKERIADYLLANGVILPTCKVGDVVWFVDRKYDRQTGKWASYVNEGYVKAIKFSSRPAKITVEYPDPESRRDAFKGADYHMSNVGKTLFLTREEAEKALREKEK